MTRRKWRTSAAAVALVSALAGCATPTGAEIERYAFPDTPDGIRAYHECHLRADELSDERESWLRACVLRIPGARKWDSAPPNSNSEAVAPPECIYLDSGYMGHGVAYVYVCSR